MLKDIPDRQAHKIVWNNHGMFVVIVDIASIEWPLQDMMLVVDLFELEMHVHIS